ncbi:sensor histidine kinase [Sulfurospirillum arcachonense]|uniref:sensor histidine kinase n=1 Tax=Sulfurospirillum arcachonense TaxID=57666 RepID=UPI00046AB2A4|nr:sensor histidine kinase [Sulfurospirillum arcachonense]
MKIKSIHSRLLTWLTIPLGLVSFLAFLIIFFLLSRNVNQHFDNALLVAEKGMEERLYVKDGVLRFALPHFGIDIQTSGGEGSVFFSVEDGNKRRLVGHEDIPKPHTTKERMFYNTMYADQEVRALYVKYEMYRNTKVYNATIIVAETLEERRALINEILLITIGITFLIVFIAIIASIFAVKKGIEPLVNLQYFIKQRDIHDLTPIEEEVPQEVDSLIKSINNLFIKLKNSFLHVENFNADVSHQLRTPLCELKVLIETDKLLKSSPNKNQYLNIIDGMAHTTQQLLLAAKTNPDAFDRDWFKPLNLSELCQKVAKEKVPFIHENGFEFAYEVSENIWINGGPIVLQELLSNLIDNAIKYAIDEDKKPIGTITLSLLQKDDAIILSVEDEGYGIPNEYLLNIYDRFFRLDTRKEGSGLGLGIVKQIAELHRALVKIENKKPQGLKVSIIFKS